MIVSRSLSCYFKLEECFYFIGPTFYFIFMKGKSGACRWRFWSVDNGTILLYSPEMTWWMLCMMRHFLAEGYGREWNGGGRGRKWRNQQLFPYFLSLLEKWPNLSGSCSLLWKNRKRVFPLQQWAYGWCFPKEVMKGSSRVKIRTLKPCRLWFKSYLCHKLYTFGRITNFLNLIFICKMGTRTPHRVILQIKCDF